MGIIILYLQQEKEISHVDKSEMNEHDRGWDACRDTACTLSPSPFLSPFFPLLFSLPYPSPLLFSPLLSFYRSNVFVNAGRINRVKNIQNSKEKTEHSTAQHNTERYGT